MKNGFSFQLKLGVMSVMMAFFLSQRSESNEPDLKRQKGIQFILLSIISALPRLIRQMDIRIRQLRNIS